MSGIETKIESFLLSLGLLNAIKEVAERLTPESFLKKAAEVFDKKVDYLSGLGELSIINHLPVDAQFATLVDRILQAAHGKQPRKIIDLYEVLEKLHKKNPELLKKISEGLLKIDAPLSEAGQTVQRAINRIFVARYFTIVDKMKDEEVLAALKSINMPESALRDLGALIEGLQDAGTVKYKCANATVSESF